MYLPLWCFLYFFLLTWQLYFLLFLSFHVPHSGDLEGSVCFFSTLIWRWSMLRFFSSSCHILPWFLVHIRAIKLASQLSLTSSEILLKLGKTFLVSTPASLWPSGFRLLLWTWQSQTIEKRLWIALLTCRKSYIPARPVSAGTSLDKPAEGGWQASKTFLNKLMMLNSNWNAKDIPRRLWEAQELLGSAFVQFFGVKQGTAVQWDKGLSMLKR